MNHFLDGYDDKISSTFEFTKDGAKIGYEHLSMGEKQILLLLLMQAELGGIIPVDSIALLEPKFRSILD